MTGFPETLRITCRGGRGTVRSYRRAARASGPKYFMEGRFESGVHREKVWRPSQKFQLMSIVTL
jgi:hypothetical protein